MKDRDVDCFTTGNNINNDAEVESYKSRTIESEEWSRIIQTPISKIIYRGRKLVLMVAKK